MVIDRPEAGQTARHSTAAGGNMEANELKEQGIVRVWLW
jgi:hypothetical protein